jgi:hypothetical protein
VSWVGRLGEQQRRVQLERMSGKHAKSVSGILSQHIPDGANCGTRWHGCDQDSRASRKARQGVLHDETPRAMSYQHGSAG